MNGLKFNWPTLGGVFIFDQMLLPMFHIGHIPFKISYFILVFWLVMKLVTPAVNAHESKTQRDFIIFSAAWVVILASGLIGEMWLETTEGNIGGSEKYRISIFYGLTLLAFGLGLQCGKINLKWLVFIFYSTAALNLAFIIFPLQLPNWLIDFYYSDLAVQQFSADFDFISDVAGLLGLTRPLGIFGNPNISAHIVNLLALFICIALRCNLLAVTHLTGFGIIVIPVISAMLLASRGEFLVACLLSMLNYRIIFKKTIEYDGEKKWRKRILFFIVILISSIGLYEVFSENVNVSSNLERISLLSDLVLTSDKLIDDSDIYEGAVGTSRYLIFLTSGALDRFLSSPLVGTGFGHANSFPFAVETRHYHNDWARLLVTSGLLGFFTMIYLLYHFARPVGWLVLIPWILPGIINSFMLVFPSFLVYWFILGIFRKKMYSQMEH
jgi:O-antigen ligase